MKPKTIKEIKQAIKDSKAYFKKKYPKCKFENGVLAVSNLKDLIEPLAVANEICTLSWVLGKGNLNCYEKRRNKNEIKKIVKPNEKQ